MRLFRNFNTAVFLSISLTGLFLASCKPGLDKDVAPDAPSSLEIPSGFSFSNKKTTNFTIQTLDNRNRGMAGIRLDIYSIPENNLLFSGVTNNSGILEATQALAAHINQVEVRTTFPGLPGKRLLNVSGGKISVTLGGLPTSGMRVNSAYSAARVSGNLDKVKTKGGWNSLGTPDYLDSNTPDEVTTSFMKDLNASLPSGKSVSKTNSAYLATNTPTTIILEKSGDVWVHFLHHDTDWKNSLGYYTFDPANPPKTVEEIKEMELIFPYIATQGNGGGLVPGHKVNIGKFAAGTGIGFFLIADAFQNGSVTNGKYTHYGHSNLNVESDPNLKRHFVLLNSPNASAYILAAEDRRRDDPDCDGDFNDAVFMIKTKPVKAIKETDMPETKEAKDTDGDGIDDSNDEFPNDPEKASKKYFPGQNVNGTLTFEDMWPSKGDYDFNDLVLSYNSEQILNAAGKVTQIKTTYKVRAIGASFKNGFAFELPIAASDVKSVTGTKLTQSYITLAPNGVEAGVSKAQIIVFDNATDMITRPAGAKTNFYNTRTDEPKATSADFVVTVTLKNPVDPSVLGLPPYNPYLIANSKRGYEIHMADFTPTQKITASLFGTKDDRSVPNSGIYYRDINNMPWVLDIPTEFEYPIETIQINEGYLKFVDWAKSKGTQHQDWYFDKPGYCDESKIIPTWLR